MPIKLRNTFGLLNASDIKVSAGYALGLKHGKTEQEELIERAANRINEYIVDSIVTLQSKIWKQ